MKSLDEWLLDYINFACLVISPLIIIITLERTLRIIKIIKEKIIRQRIFWTGMAVVFSFLFVELDFIAVLFSLSYDELVVVRRPVGAIATIAFYKIIENLIDSSTKFRIEKALKERFEKNKSWLKAIVIILVFVLFISPFYLDSDIYIYFTFVIGLSLLLFLFTSIIALNETRKVLKDRKTIEFTKYILIALIIFIIVPFVNVVSIILNIPPRYNILRIILIVPYIFSFYEASKNFIEVRSEIELESLR